MKYNISSKISFNKTIKDSTLNLVNLNQSNYKSDTMTGNHNCNCYKNKVNNNQTFFRPYKNLWYINNIKKILANNSFANNKMLYAI